MSSQKIEVETKAGKIVSVGWFAIVAKVVIVAMFCLTYVATYQ